MSLGNVPVRNGNRESKNIAENLKRFDELWLEYIRQGMTEEAAARRAMTDIAAAVRQKK